MTNLKPKKRCPRCKMLYWKKHTCQSLRSSRVEKPVEILNYETTNEVAKDNRIPTTVNINLPTQTANSSKCSNEEMTTIADLKERISNRRKELITEMNSDDRRNIQDILTEDNECQAQLSILDEVEEIENNKFEIEFLALDSLVKGAIRECEGKHIQQVSYSTYHNALTQICFNCKKIRTSLPKFLLTEKKVGE